MKPLVTQWMIGSLNHAIILGWILLQQATLSLQAKFGEIHDPYADDSILPRKGVHLIALQASFSNFLQQPSCIKKQRGVPPEKIIQ